MKKSRLVWALLMAFVLMFFMTACGAAGQAAGSAAVSGDSGASVSGESGVALENSESADALEDKEEPAEKNGDIYILYTSDVHCGVDQGFGYAGLKQVRDTLEAEGYETILVDDGDSIQGEAIGTLSKGEAVINLMNEVGYDVAIPGNHEFDYGMERFLELAEKAEFPYISCNFTYKGELVFEPYVIKEAAGKKIAFVGVTTPLTITSSTPTYFSEHQMSGKGVGCPARASAGNGLCRNRKICAIKNNQEV